MIDTIAQITQPKPSSKILIIYNKKILLFLRDDNFSIPDPNSWSLVGGEVEKGESHKQAMIREMKEEINMIPKAIEYLGKIQTPNGLFHAIFLSKPTKEEVKRIKLGNEGQKVKFFSIDEIKNLKLAKSIKKYFDLYGNYLDWLLNTNTKDIDIKRLGLIR